MKTRIKFFYTNHLWTKAMVKIAVSKKVISADEYKEITGETYKA